MSVWPWPAPSDDGGAAHLVAGLPLPAIALASSAGVPVDLSRIGGRVVVFVYPYTGTPGTPDPPGWDEIPGAHGSTAEAEGFRDLMPQLAVRGVKVFGLSAQASEVQQAFARRASITYPLLCDGELKFGNALRLPRFVAGGVTFLKRLTIMSDAGRITRVIYPVHPPDTHARQVLASL